MAVKAVTIIGDHPEKVMDRVGFGFDSHIKTIAHLIANKENKTPLVIGIYGQWGTGKTTLMRTIQTYLKNENNFPGENYRRCKTVWFQPWKYDKEEEILAALIEEIFRTMKRDKFFEACKLEIKKLAKKVNKAKLFGAVTRLLTGIDVSEFFDELEYKERLGFYDVFQSFFDELIRTYLSWSDKKTSLKCHDDTKGALVIFIDDLDRCPPARIKKVLETINLFMDREGCVFVIGADHSMIIQVLEKDYSMENASKFMEKIVQVSFHLPFIPGEEFEKYIRKVGGNILRPVTAYLHLILPVMKSNPRRLKRFINDVNLQHGLLKNSNVNIAFRLVLMWSILVCNYPKFMEYVMESRGSFLFSFQKEISDNDETMSAIENGEVTEEILKKFTDPFRDFVKDRNLVKIVSEFNCTEEQLLKLMAIREIVKSTEDFDIGDRPRIDRSIGKMVKIPRGKFIYGVEKFKRIIDRNFDIGMYPVTNYEYESFIKKGGYENDKYWGKEGWMWKNDNEINHPEYWNDLNFNDPEQPVVGVSFYEASAYVMWLNQKTGKKYRLPTELEWEKAARGTEGNIYPWGDEFDEVKCNAKESGSDKTSRVTLHPGGESSYGCFDMAGNVWEWCDSLFYETGSGRVVRGGGFSSNREDCRSDYRDFVLPEDRNVNLGFRLARSL